jgi:hypothetical protein
MWCRVEERIASIIRVKRISELGTTLAVTSNWSILRRNTNYMERIGEVGTTLAVTSNWSTLRRNTNYMKKIGEVGTTLAVISNWSTLRRNTNYMKRIGELGTTIAVTSNWSTLRRRRHIPQVGILHSHHPGKLKSYKEHFLRNESSRCVGVCRAAARQQRLNRQLYNTSLIVGLEWKYVHYYCGHLLTLDDRWWWLWSN